LAQIYAPNRLSAGASPQTPLGELTALPQWAPRGMVWYVKLYYTIPYHTPWCPLGECCKLPQWGLGRSPSRQTIWCIYLSQKEQLWWQQFLCIFITTNLNFCTNTRLLISRYSGSLRAKHSVGSRGKAPRQGVSWGTKST